MAITLLPPQEVVERPGVGPGRRQALVESGALTPVQVGGEALAGGTTLCWEWHYVPRAQADRPRQPPALVAGSRVAAQGPTLVGNGVEGGPGVDGGG